MSALILCGPHLRTGIGIIDEEHQQLIDMLNRLFTAKSEGKSNIILGYLLDDLAKCTVKHFNHEETLMRQYEYVDAAHHIEEHNKLIAELMAFKAKLESGEGMISIDLLTFLHDWLYTHILDSDKKLGEALGAMGVK
jgi:hemerythrin-like metal-binding protein